MRLDNLYHLEYSDNYLHLHCYTQNILTDKFFGFLQVFHDKLGSPYKTSS